MKGLDVLIRLARHATDERSADLGRAGTQVDLSARSIAVHEDAVAREMRVTAHDSSMAVAARHWGPHAARRRRDLGARHQDLIHHENEARDALRSAYLGLKRLELAREAQDRATRRLTARRAEHRIEEAYATMREAPRG